MNEKNSIPNEIKDSVHKVWLAGLGALSVAEDEGSKLFKNLVEKGENFENRGRERFDDLKSRVGDAADKAKERAGGTFEKVEDRLDEAVTGALRRLGVPTRDEIATLTRRVEELTAAVEQLRPTKKTSKKPVAEATTAN